MKNISVFARIAILIILFPFLSIAKETEAPKQKTVQAVRMKGTVKVDGVLNENVWQGQGNEDFVQSDPHDGSQPSEKTVVWVAYDDQALYVAARMFDSQPKEIIKRLGRRDDLVDSDWFYFSVDPYYDRRSGFQFAVNPAGSIVDWTLFNDVDRDDTWDGVWSYSARIDEKGWTAEIKIPFNQLRFPKMDSYTWGVNFRRVIKRKNERMGLVWVPKEIPGYVSHFAKLEGIQGIHPGRHIEILPYAAGKAEFSPEQEGNPFATGKSFLGNAGFDIKAGISSNLTLNATVNPDFGQVEVDPAVINLSAYETYYREKRPFFIEGSNIFDAFGRGGVAYNMSVSFPNPHFFYSRRIGRAPQGYVTQDGYTRYPDRSTILGALKLTGKLGEWNLGFINALTAREYADIDSSGSRLFEEVEPFSYYGILRVQREFNGGHQGFGVMSTAVLRDLRNDNLSGVLNQNAFTLAMDGWTYLDKNRTWVTSGWLGWTYVSGSEQAISMLQRSPLHYYQRPDASHVEVREGATTLSGWGGRFQLNKQRGNLLINFALGVLSPGFDPNDAGSQFGSSDIINMSFVVGNLWPHPGKVFRELVLAAGPFRNYDFGGNKTWDGVLLLAQGQFLNYWGFESLLAYNPETISKDLTRGGPLVRVPYGYQIDLGFNSDNRKSIVLSTQGGLYRRPTIGSENWNIGLSLRWKSRSNFSLSMGPSYMARETEYQWIRQVDDPLMTETFGSRYVFGKLQQKVLSADIRIDWIFTPRLSLQAYLQPFLAIGEYSRFKELARPKSQDYNIYGVNGSTVDFEDSIYLIDPDGIGPAAGFDFHNPDFNFKSVKGTVVLRWEYHPGSTLYFVWTQNRQDFSHPGDFNLGRDLGDLFTAPGDNIFLLKVSYRWNM